MTLSGSSDSARLPGDWEDRIAAANLAIANCHETRACPRCGAVLGERCRRMSRRTGAVIAGPALKHAHRARWADLAR
jgi:hypothetical protein